jgi:hypothetical protein
MKTPPLVAAAAALLTALALPATSRGELTVHEWGTFTVLHGSDGRPIRWYFPWQDQHQLPPFVHRPPVFFGKAAAGADGRALARMETPVIYFYPDEEMDVSVRASLPSGTLSEWFPNALMMERSASGMPAALHWVGRLMPPGSGVAALIPQGTGDAGRHYDAARAVPEAWVFQSHLPPPAVQAAPPDEPAPPVPQIDHLIFYRGGADTGLPATVAMMDDGSFELTGHGEFEVPALFAVQATPEHIAWTQITGLQPAAWEDGRNVNAKHFTFPEPVARETAIPALRQAVTETLVTEGLTPAEAAAMVETWRDLWFGETGTRVLAVLPEPWVNQTVPLTIEPAPDYTDRVYVARLEILTKSREDSLLAILNDNSTPEDAAPRLRALELGRFAQGALDRAKELQAWHLDARFQAIAGVE